MLTGRKLAARTYTNLRLTGPSATKLYVPAWPIDVTQAITIKLDEITQTVWRTEADGDVDQKDVVVASDDPFDDRWGALNHFYRWQGWESALGMYWENSVPASSQFGRNRLLLTYKGGYSTIPSDLKQAANYLVQKLWRDQQKQQTGMTVISVPQGGAVTIPDPSIPREVLSLIAPYRRDVLAAA